MDVKTEAIIVHKKNMGDFNEKYIFLTEKYGFISVYSFGSRSPKSRRAKNLINLSFCYLYLEKKKQYILKEVEVIKEFSFINTLSAYKHYFSFMNFLYSYFKTEKISLEECQFVINTFNSDYFLFSSKLKYDILRLVFYKNWGGLPGFWGCSVCGKMCSEIFYYDFFEQVIVGDKCIQIKRQPSFLEINIDMLTFLNQFHMEFSFSNSFLKMTEKKILFNQLDEMIGQFVSVIKV